jgi:PKD repeat protein
LGAANTESLSFRPDRVGSYRLALTVSDGTDSATDEVSVTVTAPPPPGSVRISFFPIGGAEASIKGPGGFRYSCPKNPHCMKLEASDLEPGNYTVSFTARGKPTASRTVTVRSGKQCIYNVERDTSVVNTKCQ